MTYDEFRCIVQHDPRFSDFRELFAHEALKRFVYHEKCILGPLSETRIFYNEYTGGEDGIAHSTQMVLDDCYGVFTPFPIKGVWIPLSEGKCYDILSSHADCPLIKTIDGEEHFLFLVHPKSEDVYAELLTHYRDKTIVLSALSLSSPRSLLISLPNDIGQFEPVMVKVSLNQAAHGIVRLLSERECALSIANTSIFNRILRANTEIDFHILEDTFSFVPQHPTPHECGMLYRELPAFLKPGSTAPLTFTVPLLALYGQRNADFFKFLVHANGGNSSLFLRKIFTCFVEAALPLLVEHELSMEAHGQNLLLMLDSRYQFTGLIYRDMGGVNTPIRADDLSLPANLRDPALSYFENHIKDAANALEHHFIWRGLFPITKQLVKNAEHFRERDPDFNGWYETCLGMQSQCDVLGNWTDGDPTSDEHRTHMPVLAFCRYGYAECLFGEVLIQHLEKLLDAETLETLKRQLYCPEQITDDLWVAPCTYRTFFDEVVRHVLTQPTPTLAFRK